MSTKRTTYEIIKSLEGSIEPIAETNIDQKHFNNLKEWCDLHDLITSEILWVTDKEDLRCYDSAKTIIDYARNYLKELNSYLTEYVQKWSDENENN
jgi:hypothetical protein